MKPIQLQILPTLAAFGPLFMVIGLMFQNVPQASYSTFQSVFKLSFAIGGALMTSSALLILAKQFGGIEQRRMATSKDTVAPQVPIPEVGTDS